jgi:hypothetical protein
MRTLFLPFCFSGALLNAQTLPELPQVFLETCYPATTTSITVCSSGCDYTNAQLQQAFNAAQPGTTILLEAGHTYVGSFTLPQKTGNGWIVIRSDLSDAQLPDQEHRIDTSYAGALANVQAPVNTSAFTFLTGAHHYYLMGLEVSTQGYVYDIIRAGDGTQTSVADLPHDLIFDRLYVHGDALLGTKRGIALNSQSTAVINCHISDCKVVGQDAQAVAGWNGPGPFKLANNFLEGSGENVMFGGANPAIQDLVPSDIEVRNNHFFKPLSWKIGDPTYAGTAWCIKNIFELKNAQRVLVEGNILENNWAHCQAGQAIVFTPRTQSGASMWSRVTDVTWRHNVLLGSDGGYNLSGHDDQLANPVSTRILIEHNLAYDISDVNKMYQILNGVEHLTIRHNTSLNAATTVSADGGPEVDLFFTDNISGYGTYGVCGTGAGCGSPGINAYFPGSTFTNNVFIGGTSNNGGIPANYPPTQWFPDLVSDVGFVDAANHDYALLAASPYTGAATDGTDVGANIDSVNAHTSGVLPGYWPQCAGISTAVPEIATVAAFSVYPNPAREEAVVHVPRALIGGRAILTNALGSVSLSIPINSVEFRVPLIGIPSQVMTILFKSPSGSPVALRKLVVAY